MDLALNDKVAIVTGGASGLGRRTAEILAEEGARVLVADQEREWARMYPLQRLGVPDDIAPMIVFLCSDSASWITGQAISINGGFGRS